MTSPKRHMAYLNYVLRHKWFVFLEAWKLGIRWQGLTHDMSKFLPREWFAYACTFFDVNGADKPKLRDKTGYYDPALVSLEFRKAWLHHQRNKHHWQAWCVIGDRGKIVPLEMPVKYRKEMLADWQGAGRAHRNPGAARWYWANRDKMVLDENTRTWIEQELPIRERSGNE